MGTMTVSKMVTSDAYQKMAEILNVLFVGQVTEARAAVASLIHVKPGKVIAQIDISKIANISVMGNIHVLIVWVDSYRKTQNVYPILV